MASKILVFDKPGIVLHTVISGGQTGADLAGVMVAKEFGFETGGMVPKGWKTQAGSQQKMLQSLGLTEHSSEQYKPRTWHNVQNSDATFRFASNFYSPGEICTLNGIKKYQKPSLDFPIVSGKIDPSLVVPAMEFLREHRVQVLNIAGNADGNNMCGKHFEAVVQFLFEFFPRLKNHDGK